MYAETMIDLLSNPLVFNLEISGLKWRNLLIQFSKRFKVCIQIILMDLALSKWSNSGDK